MLKSLPYLISIAGGIILFSISVDTVKDPAVEALISNISASLLAIPLVFLLYDYTTSRVSRRLQETLVANMNEKVNTIMVHIILLLRKMLNVRGRPTIANIIALRRRPESQISKELHIKPDQIDQLHQYYEELENLILGYGKENALPPNEFRALSELAREMARAVNARRLGGGRVAVARHIKNIITIISDWLDSGTNIANNFGQMVAQTTQSTAINNEKITK